MVYLPTQVPTLGSAQRKKVRLLRAVRGIPALVDPAETQEQIVWLRSIGFLDNAIGAAAGVPEATVTNIRKGVYASARIEQASRIRTVTHVPVKAQMRSRVPALGATRRIRALSALGHTAEVIGGHLDMPADAVSKLCGEFRVMGSTWFRVCEVYEELSCLPGESVIARRRASARGFPAPLDWEGWDIDHPGHMPVATKEDKKLVDEVLVARILKGGYTGPISRLERAAVMDHALAHGWTNTRVAEVLGVRLDSASRAIIQHRAKSREVAS
jgi:hypothetical protein